MSAVTIDARRFRTFERQAHDRIADSYEAFFAPVTAQAAEPLLDAAGVGSDVRVLDVATGPGAGAARAASGGAAVTGVDIAPRMQRRIRGALPASSRLTRHRVSYGFRSRSPAPRA